MNNFSRITTGVVALALIAGWLYWSVYDRQQQGEQPEAATKSEKNAQSALASATRSLLMEKLAVEVPSTQAKERADPWHRIQRSGDLRASILHATNSNDPREAAAALNAILYCAHVANADDAPEPQVAVQRQVTRFPGDENVARSPVEVRAAVLVESRRRCSFGGDANAKRLDSQLRGRIADALGQVRDLESALGRLPQPINLSSLSSANRALLASGELYVYSSVVKQLAYRAPPDPTIPLEQDVSLLLAADLAMCTLGDDCAQGSFRADRICIEFGACQGRDVAESIRSFLQNRPADLRRVDVITAYVLDTIATVSR